MLSLLAMNPALITMNKLQHTFSRLVTDGAKKSKYNQGVKTAVRLFWRLMYEQFQTGYFQKFQICYLTKLSVESQKAVIATPFTIEIFFNSNTSMVLPSGSLGLGIIVNALLVMKCRNYLFHEYDMSTEYAYNACNLWSVRVIYNYLKGKTALWQQRGCALQWTNF